MVKTALIIEDETRILYWIQKYFEKEGFVVLTSQDGLDGLNKARSEKPDVIILDLMLPKMNGEEVCRIIRQESNVPIIMLTAKSQEREKISGLMMGADDYVVKPFSPGELIARVHALLRRAEDKVFQPGILRNKDIIINLEANTCQVRGEEVPLSRIQFDLLAYFMQHPGQNLSRQQILNEVFVDNLDVFDRAVDVHIRRLRQKIEQDPSKPNYIQTVFGMGYKFLS